jgi:rod shape-determining protein MreC
MRRTVVAPLVALQIESENERLRKLLGLGQQLRWGFVPAEALHSRSLGEEFTITLTAGGKAGIKAFSPVVAPEGLVGMVHTVDPSMSLAILWAHPDFRVSAMAADGSAFGIAAAHLGGGPERYLLELRGVPFRSTLKAGTMIVSSGLGGVYPRGIPIGTVVSELRTPEGWARTYLVRPAVLPPDVTSVMVLSPQRGASGVASVWAMSTAAADSAARGITADADSIARTAALAEVAARRAVLDSTRRDSVRRDSVRRAIVRRPPAPATTGATPAIAAPVTPAPVIPPVAVPVAPRPDSIRADTGRPATRDTTPSRPDTARPRPDTARPEPDTTRPAADTAARPNTAARKQR